MIETVELTPEHEARLHHVARAATGTPLWRARKRAEARDLLRLAQAAPRLRVVDLDLRTHLDALVHLRVPVPCRPPLTVFPQAILAVRYREEALRTPLPGYAFVQIVAPRDVFHANVSTDAAQALCLGASLPAGIPLKEIVLASYAALSLQAVQIDERDPAGVMNHEAAVWWQQHLDRAPLSREPFLAPEDPA